MWSRAGRRNDPPQVQEARKQLAILIEHGLVTDIRTAIISSGTASDLVLNIHVDTPPERLAQVEREIRARLSEQTIAIINDYVAE